MSFYIQDHLSLTNKPFPKTVKKTPPNCKKTLLCTRLSASYTLEVAVVLPLLAGFFASILFFFRVLQVQTQVQEALIYAGRKTACEACVTDSTVVLRASTEAYFRRELSQYEQAGKYIKGGAAGISLLGSEFSDCELHLQADYRIHLPIAFFAVKDIRVSQNCQNRKWTGDGDDGQGRGEDYVYVTEYGSVYHRQRTCPYLDLSIQAVSAGDLGGLRNKDGHKYYACPDCVAENSSVGTIYITDYGTCYHKSLSCSGLKRTVYLVPMSETGGKGACSRCSAGEEKNRE